MSCGNPAVILFDEAGNPVFSSFSKDAFGRLRVSTPESIFDSKQVFDDQSLVFDKNLVSGATATHSALMARTRLAVTTTVGSKATRQSYRYFNYQPGKSHLIFITFAASAGGEVGREKRFGYFDDDNGCFGTLKSDGYHVTVRTNTSGTPSDAESAHSSTWNIDKMDGTGASGIDLQKNKSQIMFVDFEWLGVGIVRFGFVIGGVGYYVHAFKHSNILDVVYMSTPNLPVRWEIETTGAGATGTSHLDSICCSVMSEAGHNPTSTVRAIDNDVTGVVIDNSGLWPLISMRLKASHNRASVFPTNVGIMSITGANAKWALVFRPTLTNATWVDDVKSAVQYDVSSDAVISGGYQVSSGHFSKNIDQADREIKSVLALASNIAGVSDIYTLAAKKIGASTETLFGSIGYQEFL